MLSRRFRRGQVLRAGVSRDLHPAEIAGCFRTFSRTLRRGDQGAPAQMRPTPAKDRALFLKDRAFELVSRQGTLDQIPGHGVGRTYDGPAFKIWYADPESSECDEYHHLDIWADRKVLSVVWLTGQPPEVVSFKRGSWEHYFLA